MTQFRGWICSEPIYRYEGWLFEAPLYSKGPWPLTKDMKLRKNAGYKFYKMIEKFESLPDDEKETYRVGGGCQRF